MLNPLEQLGVVPTSWSPHAEFGHIEELERELRWASFLRFRTCPEASQDNKGTGTDGIRVTRSIESAPKKKKKITRSITLDNTVVNPTSKPATMADLKDLKIDSLYSIKGWTCLVTGGGTGT